MKEFKEKNDKRIADSAERAERKAREDEDKAERKEREAEQRVERQKLDNERRATLAGEKAERDKLKAEEKLKFDRIKAEERADRERLRADEKVARDAQKEKERQERLDKVREKAAAGIDEDDIGPTDTVPETKEFSESDDDATTRITGETTASGNIVEDEMDDEGIKTSNAARDVASRVFGAPVDEVAEADKTIMTRSVETEDGGLKTLEENVEVDQDETERLMKDHILSGGNVETTGETAVDTETDSKLSPAVSPPARRESRRKSFFTKLKSSFASRGSTRTSGTTKTAPTTTSPTEETETVSEGPSIVGASTDGTAASGATEHQTAATRQSSEGGLYSEPSDTTERPNEDRAAEHDDNVSSMYATDDADYDEARARTSTSSAERFDDAREKLDAESVATTARENPFDDQSSTSHSKFREAV